MDIVTWLTEQEERLHSEHENACELTDRRLREWWKLARGPADSDRVIAAEMNETYFAAELAFCRRALAVAQAYEGTHNRKETR